MKKNYEQPSIEMVKFEVTSSIMSNNDPGVDLGDGTSDIEGGVDIW